jgi:2,3-dihydroxybiphenyl 1,2-dioxygenase
MTGVSALAYVNFDVDDLGRWKGIYTDVFGAELVERLDGGVNVRLDEMGRRIGLYPCGREGVRSVGWELPNAEALTALVGRLKGMGHNVTEGSRELCAERGVEKLFRFHEPYLSVETELIVGQLSKKFPFRASRAIKGYKTEGMGLGHVVFHSHDLEGAVAFYREVMGFGLSDYMAWDDIEAIFLHCNARHHSLAIMNLCMGRQSGAFNHLMLEAQSIDDVGYAYDVVRDQQIPLLMEMGKHTNDHMQSFYILTPGNYGIEYGYGGRLIDESWQVRRYDQPMLYGHRVVAG